MTTSTENPPADAQDWPGSWIAQRLRIPEGAVAEFGIRVHDVAQIDFIEINRKRVFSSQRYSPRAPYRCLGQENAHLLIELPAGEYRIHTRLHD